MKNIIQVISKKIQSNHPPTEQPDWLVQETPLDIRLAFGEGKNRRREPLVVTMRTPGNDENLALGFLLTEGIISRPDDLRGFRVLEENTLLAELAPTLPFDFQRFKRNFFSTSSCGLCGKASVDAIQTITCYHPLPNHPKLPETYFFSLPDKLRAAQPAFDLTGGLHAAALFDPAGNLKFLREDIGRHNAVDKVIGAAVAADEQLPLRDFVLLVSGRAGFELVQKSVMVGLPVLAAVGAASSLAVEMAESGGLTLIGFLRDARFNIYSFSERII